MNLQSQTLDIMEQILLNIEKPHLHPVLLPVRFTSFQIDVEPQGWKSMITRTTPNVFKGGPVYQVGKSFPDRRVSRSLKLTLVHAPDGGGSRLNCQTYQWAKERGLRTVRPQDVFTLSRKYDLLKCLQVGKSMFLATSAGEIHGGLWNIGVYLTDYGYRTTYITRAPIDSENWLVFSE